MRRVWPRPPTAHVGKAQSPLVTGQAQLLQTHNMEDRTSWWCTALAALQSFFPFPNPPCPLQTCLGGPLKCKQPLLEKIRPRETEQVKLLAKATIRTLFHFACRPLRCQTRLHHDAAVVIALWQGPWFMTASIGHGWLL